MSVRIMGGVWDLDLPPPQKLVLLAMADHADHDGRRVHPSVRLIAHKTGYSERQVQYIVRGLEESGILEVEQLGGGRGHPTHYRIVLEKGAKTSPFMTGMGAIPAPIEPIKGAIHDTERVQSAEERVQTSSRASPDKKREPSVVEPPREEPAPTEPTSSHPWGLFEAMCDELGRDATDVSSESRGKQLAVAKRLIAAGMSAPDVRRMTRWLSRQRWLESGVDLFVIEKQRSKWEVNGKPEGPRTLPPGHATMVKPGGGSSVVPRTVDDKEAIRERARQRIAERSGQPAIREGAADR